MAMLIRAMSVKSLFKYFCATVAQLAEQHFCKVKVVGSSPTCGSNFYSNIRYYMFYLFNIMIITKNYWIDPSGKIIKCGSHEQYAKMLFPQSSDVYKEMYKNKYIKVVIEPLPEMYIHYLKGQYINPRQLNSIKELSIDAGLDGNFNNVPELRESRLRLRYKDFYK